MTIHCNNCIRCALYAVAVFSLGVSSAPAQDTQDAARADVDQRIEEILVTGTQVRNRKYTNTTPIDVLDRSVLESSSVNQLQDVLKDIPANTGSVFADEAGLSAGTGQFNIRGLGLASTLTLINGRRGGVAPVADPTGGDFTDINQFPVSAVQRIEILKDGASSIYGSEAVSGVANIITRKGFEGFELTADFESANNDAYSLGLASGKHFDDATFNFYATYDHQDRANRADLDFVVDRLNGGGVDGRSRLTSASGSPGTYFPATFDADGNPIGVVGGVGFPDPNCEAAGGFFAIRDDGTLNKSFCRHSFFNQQSIIPEANRVQVFAEFDMPLSDAVTYFAEASYARNEFRDDNGPLPTANGLIAANGAGRLFIPADHPFNFFIADPADPTQLIYIDPANFDPAVHNPVPLAASARPLGRAFNQTGIDELDQRREFNYTRILSGLEIDVGDNWIVSASHMFASSNFSGSIPLTYRMDIFNQLLLDGTFNPFGTAITDPDLISPRDGVSVAGNSQAVIDRFTTVANRDIRTTQNVVDLLLAGEIGGVGSGPIGVAFGGQYRKLELTDNPDSLISAGEARVTSVSNSINGDQEVFAVFGEGIVPLSDWGEVQLALRYEDYGASDDSVDPKVAFAVFPTEVLTLRGSWGTAFQAPTLRQVAEQANFEFIDDPTIPGVGPQNAECLPPGEFGVSQGTIVRTLGNEDLVAQSSTSFTLGVVFQSGQSFNGSLDYWSFEYEDLIAPGLNGQSIVDNDCAEDGIANDPRVIRDGGGQLQEVQTSFENVGLVETDGVDLALSYRVGDFSLSADAAYVLSFDVTDAAGITIDRVGSRNATNSFNTLPELRGVLGLDWQRDDHAANVTVRYTDGYDNDQSNDAPIDSFTTVDIQYRIDLSDAFGTSRSALTVGIENVFDEDPPGLVRNDVNGNRITGTIADYDRPGYDPRSGASLRGRIAYVRAEYGF